MLCYPIHLITGEVTGVYVAYNSKAERFTDDDAKMMKKAIDIFSVCLRNVHVFNMAARSVARADTLLKTAQSVLETQNNLHELIHTVLREASEFLECSHGAVCMASANEDNADAGRKLQRIGILNGDQFESVAEMTKEEASPIATKSIAYQVQTYSFPSSCFPDAQRPASSSWK